MHFLDLEHHGEWLTYSQKRQSKAEDEHDNVEPQNSVRVGVDGVCEWRDHETGLRSRILEGFTYSQYDYGSMSHKGYRVIST